MAEADPQIHVRVTDEELSVDALSRTVSRADAGAIVIFCGVTREVDRLDYEAYREMACEKITLIATDCVKRHGLAAAAIEHRVGHVRLGEASVIVAVSGAHREEAFAGAREAIDRVKADAPIWKREVDLDGTGRWVDGTEPQPAPDPAANAAPSVLPASHGITQAQ